MDDLISRQAAIEIASGYCHPANIAKELAALPSAKPEITMCQHCKLWDRDTIRHQSNDFESWEEAECEWLASLDGYNEIDHYTASDDFCSHAERREQEE